ncbi:50S ribosomal protein L11 methyltransferase [Silvanigrella aquatica]|uniref:Uncharacterized protein n=1 Tax=Silvanigrella aquatica TaxID=1915309 RepID=A0A1L4D2X2_9BACT|nr:50S ribosomal protein L11 methyltransferase [Silvanigrella aquatica]APJ04553.1 hypothetical protein AXG55_11810 [Silvanigrella aquatica]
MSKQNNNHKLLNLNVAKGLRLRFADDGNTYASISSSSGEFYMAPEVLSLLCLLGNKNLKYTLKEIPGLLKKQFQNISSNLPNEAECSALIEDLIGAGILLLETNQTSKHMQSDGFGDPWAQWTMLADEFRSQAYFKALKKHINNNSIVLDVGSGTGFLSAISLHLGAKKVVAIEETNTANCIKPILNQLKLNTSNKSFILHNMNSFDVTLNDEITTIVSELFGNDPFQEGVLPTLREIGSRLFDKKINYIPQSVAVFFDIIDLLNHPALHRIKAFQQFQNKNFYKEEFLTEFLCAAGKTLDLNEISFSLPLNKNDFIAATKSTEIGSTRLDPPPTFSKDLNKHPFYGKKTIKINHDCQNALALIWFRAELTKDVTISSLISEQDACAHWSPIAIPLKKTLMKNDIIEIHHELNDTENYIHCKIFHNNEKIGSR